MREQTEYWLEFGFLLQKNFQTTHQHKRSPKSHACTTQQIQKALHSAHTYTKTRKKKEEGRDEERKGGCERKSDVWEQHGYIMDRSSMGATRGELLGFCKSQNDALPSHTHTHTRTRTHTHCSNTHGCAPCISSHSHTFIIIYRRAGAVKVFFLQLGLAAEEEQKCNMHKQFNP